MAIIGMRNWWNYSLFLERDRTGAKRKAIGCVCSVVVAFKQVKGPVCGMTGIGTWMWQDNRPPAGPAQRGGTHQNRQDIDWDEHPLFLWGKSLGLFDCYRYGTFHQTKTFKWEVNSLEHAFISLSPFQKSGNMGWMSAAWEYPPVRLSFSLYMWVCVTLVLVKLLNKADVGTWMKAEHAERVTIIWWMMLRWTW